MNTQFFDRQDPRNPHNGAKLHDAAEFIKCLAEAKGRPPFFCELIGDNGYKLLLGVGEAVGCAQYSASDGSPPHT